MERVLVMEKETLNLIIGGAIGIVSALIGGGLSVLGGEFKSWRDERRNKIKVLKTALYHQMELYGEVIRLDPRLHSVMTEMLGEALLDLGAKPEEVKNLESFRPQLGAFIGQINTVDIKNIGERYEAIIERVAEVDPMLAVRISQRFSIGRSSITEASFDQLISSLGPANAETHAFISNLRYSQVEDHNKNFICSVEESIRETAKLLGKRIEKEAWNHLTTAKDDFVSKDSPELKQFIERFKASILGAVPIPAPSKNGGKADSEM